MFAGCLFGSVRLGAMFGIDSESLVEEILPEHTQGLVLCGLFPNISITLQQIGVFQTSRTDCTHTNRK